MGRVKWVIVCSDKVAEVLCIQNGEGDGVQFVGGEIYHKVSLLCRVPMGPYFLEKSLLFNMGP